MTKQRINSMVQLKKQLFVSTELLHVLKKIDGEILNAYYQRFPNGVEHVTVQYKGQRRIVVDVTGNSLGCIAIDVIKRVIY